MFYHAIHSCFWVWVLARRVGAKPHIALISYEKRRILWTEEQAIRLVQSLIQVELLNPVFGLFGLVKAKNQPKKVLQGQNQKEKAIAFRWGLTNRLFDSEGGDFWVVFSKIRPVPCGTFSFIYKSEIEQMKKVSNTKGL